MGIAILYNLFFSAAFSLFKFIIGLVLTVWGIQRLSKNESIHISHTQKEFKPTTQEFYTSYEIIKSTALFDLSELPIDCESNIEIVAFNSTITIFVQKNIVTSIQIQGHSNSIETPEGIYSDACALLLGPSFTETLIEIRISARNSTFIIKTI